MVYNESTMYKVPALFGCAIDTIFAIEKRLLMEKGMNRNCEGYMQNIPKFGFCIFSPKNFFKR